MPPTPSRFAESILRFVLPYDDAETISGDLEEMFHVIAAREGRRAARRWHWRQVASIVGATLFRRAHAPADSNHRRTPRRTTMGALRQDVGYAIRSLRKQPGFTTTVVLMLALGVGANVAIFSLIHAVVLKPLPLAEPDRLMLFHTLMPDREAPGVFRPGVWSYPKYQVVRQHQRVFESMALFRPGTWNVTGTQSPERVLGEFVEASYFDVLGVAPAVGRSFSAEETRAPGSAPLAVLGHGFWTRRFGGDPSAVGRAVGLNGIPHTVVGVVPPGFRGLSGEADVWVPLTTAQGDDLTGPQSHSFTLVARRKADVSVEQAQAAAPVLGAIVDEQYRDTFNREGTRWSARAVPLHDERIDPVTRRSMLMLLWAVTAVLLIVCINVANLMFARAMGRQREVGIRLALGASRLRIVRQLMTESLLLAAVGAAAGLFVAYAFLSTGASLMPDLRVVMTGSRSTIGLTRVGLNLLQLDARVVLYAAGVAALTALFFGLAPALRASRRDLTMTMKSGSPGAVSSGLRGFSIRNILVTGEVALALVLLAAGGLMVKSVVRLQQTELGFNPASVLTLRLSLPAPQYDGPRATQMFEQLLTRLASHPQIEGVAYSNSTPVGGGGNSTLATFPGRPPAARGMEPVVGVFWTSPDYFKTLGIRLLRGRVFTEHDRAGQPKVVVINETAARKLWGNEDPIGKRIGVGQGGFRDGAEVVGIVADVRYGAVETSINPDVYLPLLQSPRSAGVVFIRSRATTDALVPIVRREVQALDPDLPLVDIKMMEERFGDITWRTRMSAWLLGMFAALGLLLSALGVYGVMSQGVQQRTREIGVRIALGAARRDILWLIIGRVLRVSLVGIGLGVLLAIPAMNLLRTLLYQVEPRDPAVFVPLALVLLGVALLAGYLPAQRATRVDPLMTLRAE